MLTYAQRLHKYSDLCHMEEALPPDRIISITIQYLKDLRKHYAIIDAPRFCDCITDIIQRMEEGK